MTKGELMLEGVNLMIAGMGFVMVFLLLLVYAVQLMSRIIARFTPDIPLPVTPIPQPEQPLSSTDDALTKVAIAAALHHHRRTHDKK